MPAEQSLADLHSRWKRIALLESTLALLGWDEQVMMPPAGQAWRGEQAACLSGLIHSELASPGLATTLDQLEAKPPDDPLIKASVREARRRQSRSVKVPGALVEELARVCSQAQPVWAKARQQSDFKLFLPLLEKIIHLKREEASAVGWKDHPYNALLDEYEPGMDCARLDILFGDLQKPLATLVSQAGEKQSGISTQPAGNFPIPSQKLLGEAAAKALGFRFDAGRLDTSTHPFCSGLAPGDCRLTTRYQPDGFLESFFGVLHETGHGLYEQGLPEACRAEPWCQAASLGMHESQSRLWENMVGRTRSFWEHFHPIANAIFGNGLDDWPLDRLRACMHSVRPSFIRVEADETTYNLHILLRYRLEKALLDGSLSARDLPGAWNDLFFELFGLRVPDDRNGCLQDIHWSGGGFGYFPTYTLGNLYAAQLMRAAKRDLGDLDADFRHGVFARLLSWLRDKVHRLGRSQTAQEICQNATGAPLSTLPLLEHLKSLGS
jgi:carboxypeptidase Taq